jgi:hypothetical protein
MVLVVPIVLVFVGLFTAPRLAPVPLVVAFGGVTAMQSVMAPFRQRNEARGRVRAARKALTQYRITPLDVDLAPAGVDRPIVRINVRNDGRPGKFTAVLERVEGLDPDETLETRRPLQWAHWPDVTDEEIPRQEERTIGVAEVFRDGNTTPARFGVRAIGPAGAMPHVAPSYAPPGDACISVWVRISLRGEERAEYSRRVGVQLRWVDGEGPFLDPLFPDEEEARVNDEALADALGLP